MTFISIDWILFDFLPFNFLPLPLVSSSCLSFPLVHPLMSSILLYFLLCVSSLFLGFMGYSSFLVLYYFFTLPISPRRLISCSPQSLVLPSLYLLSFLHTSAFVFCAV